MSIRVLLADDHPMLREGLRSILEKHPDIAVVGEASDGRAVLDLVGMTSPDVIVMDVGMTGLNGIEATGRVRAKHPRTKVVALSAHSDKRYVLAMLEAGARGYVLKEAAVGERVRAIRATVKGEVFLSPRVAGAVVDSLGAQRPAASPLGGREREVVQLIGEGKTSKEIAQVLRISTGTVEAHRRNIMKKLDLHSIAELTKYAIRHGLTTPDR